MRLVVQRVLSASVAVEGEIILLIPQFTLYGDVIKNNRPNFRRAMSPDKASELFDYFFDKCSEEIHTEKGVFGAFMDVKLNNYGPVTIIVEKEFKD